MLNDQLTMLIHSCDKFSDLWDAHVQLLQKNWPDRSLRTFLVTDAPSDKRYAGIELFSAGEGVEFTQRVQAVLPHIQTEYVLVTLDDYFPIYPIDTQKIQYVIDCMEREQLDYVRLFRRPDSKLAMDGCEPLYHADFGKGNYVVNLYVGIWRKSFMEKTLGETMNIWQYEVSLTHCAKALQARCAMSKGQEFEILDVVRKGKLLHKAARYLKKHDLYHGDRPVIAYKEELRLWVFDTIKKLTPKSFVRWLKRVGSKCGMTFYSGVD